MDLVRHLVKAAWKMIHMDQLAFKSLSVWICKIIVLWICWISCFQQPRFSASPMSRTSKSVTSPKHHRQDKNISGWSWLDRWMAVKPWESKMMTNPSELTPLSRKSDDQVLSFHPYSSDHDLVKVRRENVTTRISARPLSLGQISRSSSAPSSESLYDESRASTSSTSTSPTLVSSNTLLMETIGERNLHTPSYMNLTESTRAKQRACRYFSHSLQSPFMEDFLCHKKPTVVSNGDMRSIAGSNPSVDLSKDLYPPVSLVRHNRVIYQQQH